MYVCMYYMRGGKIKKSARPFRFQWWEKGAKKKSCTVYILVSRRAAAFAASEAQIRVCVCVCAAKVTQDNDCCTWHRGGDVTRARTEQQQQRAIAEGYAAEGRERPSALSLYTHALCCFLCIYCVYTLRFRPLYIYIRRLQLPIVILLLILFFRVSLIHAAKTIELLQLNRKRVASDAYIYVYT